MQSTGIGTGAVYAHAAPIPAPARRLPPDEDELQRADQGHFTISVGPETNDYPPWIHPRSRVSSTVQRRENARSHRPPQGNGRQSPRINPTTTRTDGSQLTTCRLRIPPAEPHRHPYLPGTRHTDDSESTMMFTANASKCRYRRMSMSRTASAPNASCLSSSDERRQEKTSGYLPFSRTNEHLQSTPTGIRFPRRCHSLIQGHTNFLRRQPHARMRKPNEQGASSLLAVVIAPEPEYRVDLSKPSYRRILWEKKK